MTELSKNYLSNSSLVGIEPTTFGLEVQRAIRCATGTVIIQSLTPNNYNTIYLLIITECNTQFFIRGILRWMPCLFMLRAPVTNLSFPYIFSGARFSFFSKP